MKSYDSWKCDSGRDTEAWEGPQTTACVRCGGEAPIPEGGDYRSITWCAACEEKAQRRREQRHERTA